MQIGKKRKKVRVPKVIPINPPERVDIPERGIEVPNWPAPVEAPVEQPVEVG